MMRLLQLFFVIALIQCSLSGFSLEPKLILYPAPQGATLSTDYAVFVNGKSIDLYGSTTRWGSTASFGYFDFEGEVTIEVIANFGPSHDYSMAVLPENLGIAPETVKSGHLRFTINKPTNLSVVCAGDYQGKTLHLIADAPETSIPDKNDKNVLFYSPGYYTIGETNNRTIELKDNQTLYIAGGAVVNGLVKATNAKNIKICGRGILTQTADLKLRQRSIDLRGCTGIDISGIIENRNYEGWSGYIALSTQISISDFKVISPAIWSTDGMNLANCSNAHYSNCFFRCGDDNIAIKGLGDGSKHSSKTDDPQSFLPNKDILVENCQFWSDNNNAVVLGQETLTSGYENITFRNCDVLFVRDDEPEKAVISLISLHGTNFKNITFEDFRVGPSGQLISAFYTEEIFRIKGAQKWPGKMESIVFKNITAKGSGTKTILLAGWNETNCINGITFDNIVINGEKLKKHSHYLNANEFVKNIEIK